MQSVRRSRAWSSTRGASLLFLAFAALAPSVAAAQTRSVPARVSFSLSRGALAERARQVPEGGLLRLVQVPLGGDVAVLNLQRFEVFTDDARVMVHDAAGATTTIQPPERTYFRGSVDGEEGSLAFLAVGKSGEVRGLVLTANEAYVVGAGRSDAPADEPLIVGAATDLLAKSEDRPFTCGADALHAPGSDDQTWMENVLAEKGEQAFTVPDKAAASYSMVVAIETDFEFYALFNNVNNAAAYIGDLMGAMSAIYYRDVATTLRVNYVSLWTGGAASDPWSAGSTIGLLCEFGTWFHTNRPLGTYPRATAHLMSGKALGGGVAWIGAGLGGLCSADFDASSSGCGAGQFGGGYGITASMSGNFLPTSATVVWDLMATTHEIGHNFGSPHTHCYNNVPTAGNPSVDQCRSGETDSHGACYSGAQSLPAGGKGSIMSYCHLLGSVANNIALSFGSAGLYGTNSERVPALMSAFVASRSASCRKRIDAPPADFNGDGRSELWIFQNGAWREYNLWPNK